MSLSGFRGSIVIASIRLMELDRAAASERGESESAMHQHFPRPSLVGERDSLN